MSLDSLYIREGIIGKDVEYLSKRKSIFIWRTIYLTAVIISSIAFGIISAFLLEIVFGWKLNYSVVYIFILIPMIVNRAVFKDIYRDSTHYYSAEGKFVNEKIPREKIISFSPTKINSKIYKLDYRNERDNTKKVYTYLSDVKV